MEFYKITANSLQMLFPSERGKKQLNADSVETPTIETNGTHQKTNR